MTFFEQELKRIFEEDMGLSDIRIVGNTCYGRLSGDIRMKAYFDTYGVANRYEVLKITMVNRHEGPIDSLALRFFDLWGRKRAGNPRLYAGIYPYMCNDGNGMEWFVYKPTESDYRQLSRAVSDYLDVFREPVQEQTIGHKMC